MSFKFLRFWIFSTLIFLINVLFVSESFAQLSVVFPKERAIFQRNTENDGKIHISGYVDQYADQIEARLVPRASGFGTQTDWQVIDSSLEGLSFTGYIEGKGGWYRLELRSVRDGSVTFFNAVERVGIGEVFIIAGQSNAQGEGLANNAKGAVDDRVNAFSQDYFNHTEFLPLPLPENFEYGSFVQLRQNLNIGPFGYTPWAYGELGDLLVKKLNVPVLFFNAAFTGTSSDNWFKSIRGDDTFHATTGEKFQKFFPYLTLKKTLNSYIKILGLRAILWHQGEFDFNVNEATYFDNIKKVIDETRFNTGRNVPWVISRVSRLFNTNFTQIISAQNRLIAGVSNVWPGPATDDIQPLRPDGAHFANTPTLAGLSALAIAWNNSLTNDFFRSITPVSPDNIVEIKHDCIDQNSVRVRFDNIYTSYKWSNNNTNSQQILSSGEISASLKDGFGNYLLTNKLVIPNVYPKITPSFTSSPGLRVCEGNAISFETLNPKYQVVWNVGFVGNKFVIDLPGTYSSRYLTVQGCFSGKSEEKTAQIISKPPKPTVFATDNIKYACDGKTLEFYILNPQNHVIEWSTGENTIGVRTNKNLNKPIFARTFSNYDCPSPWSDSISYKILKNPKTLTLEKFGPYSLKAINTEPISRFDWFLDNKPFASNINPDLIINQDGFYSVRATNKYDNPDGTSIECYSGQSTQLSVLIESKLYGISLFPNPSKEGKFYISSNLDLKDVSYRLIGPVGHIIDFGVIGNVSAPVMLDFSNKRLAGKYFLEIYYNNVKRIYPVFID